MGRENPPPHALDRAFVRRTLFQFGVAAALFLLWRLADVVVLAFGAVVVASMLRAIADPIRDRTRLGDGASLAVACVVVVGVVALGGWLFGSMLVVQISDLIGRLPANMAAVRTTVATWPLGPLLVRGLDEASQMHLQLHGLAGRLGGYAISAFGAVANTILVVFTGFFLALDPHGARNAALAMFPKGPRAALAPAFDASGRALRLWLLGMVVEMFIVGVLTGLGAWAIGLPSPLALGAIAAILDFIPFVGPIASIVPGLLVAIPMGFSTVLWTLALYVGVQQFEGNVLYPFIQRRAVNLPPALSLIALLVFAVLFGPVGVVLATPLLVVLLTLTKMLYLRNALDEDVHTPDEPRKA
jgi:predicted PurR-regulated permease PerM